MHDQISRMGEAADVRGATSSASLREKTSPDGFCGGGTSSLLSSPERYAEGPGREMQLGQTRNGGVQPLPDGSSQGVRFDPQSERTAAAAGNILRPMNSVTETLPGEEVAKPNAEASALSHPDQQKFGAQPYIAGEPNVEPRTVESHAASPGSGNQRFMNSAAACRPAIQPTAEATGEPKALIPATANGADWLQAGARLAAGSTLPNADSQAANAKTPDGIKTGSMSQSGPSLTVTNAPSEGTGATGPYSGESGGALQVSRTVGLPDGPTSDHNIAPSTVPAQGNDGELAPASTSTPVSDRMAHSGTSHPAHICATGTPEVRNTKKSQISQESASAENGESRKESTPPTTMQPNPVEITKQTTTPSQASTGEPVDASVIGTNVPNSVAAEPRLKENDAAQKPNPGALSGIAGPRESKPAAAFHQEASRTSGAAESRPALPTIPSLGLRDETTSHRVAESSARTLNGGRAAISDLAPSAIRATNQGEGPVPSASAANLPTTELRGATGKIPAPSLNTGLAFDRLDSATAPQTIASTPQRLAVGVHNAGLGWVEIHAHNTQGLVSATLATGSVESRNAVSAQLPGIREYLTGEQLHVGDLGTEVFSSSSGNRSGSSQHGPEDGASRSVKPTEQADQQPNGPFAEVNPESLSYINVRV